MGSPIALAFPFSYTTHPAFIPPTFITPGVAHSATVRVNALPVHRMGDISEIHCIPIIPPVCDIETFVSGGATTVFCEGRPLALICPVSSPGDCIATWSSHTVFVGDGVASAPLNQITT